MPHKQDNTTLSTPKIEASKKFSNFCDKLSKDFLLVLNFAVKDDQKSKYKIFIFGVVAAKKE